MDNNKKNARPHAFASLARTGNYYPICSGLSSDCKCTAVLLKMRRQLLPLALQFTNMNKFASGRVIKEG